MTRLVDLTPPTCRYEFSRRRFIRRWVLAYLVGVLAIAGVYVSQRSRIGPQRAHADALQAESIARWKRHEEIQALLTERDELTQAIARYDRLAPAVASSDVIDLIGHATPENVTITFLALVPREDKHRRPVPGQASEVTVEPYLAVEIEGVAADDEALTRFVADLDGRSLFERVGIEYARSEPVGAVMGRRFRLSGRIGLTQRYEMVSADGEGVDR